MKVSVKGNEMTIVIPLEKEPQPSASGKTLGLFSSHGNQVTDAKFHEQPITIGLNVYVKNPDFKKA